MSWATIRYVSVYGDFKNADIDLRAVESVTIAPLERRLVSTGLAVAIPDGCAGFAQLRGGMALRL